MRSSYRSDEVEFLLKDVTGRIEALPAEERERQIQSGRHYCEMLPMEYRPTEDYLQLYDMALRQYGQATADAVCVLAERLYERKGAGMVLVSLARAGVPIGILLRRYLSMRYGAEVKHYAVSIIRGRGIDRNAMAHILERYAPEDIQFVDGWTGKGAIAGQLREAMGDYPGVDPTLAVLSDPAGVTELYGTREDFLIPSSCLNATVTGLVSRTVLRDDLIGPGDFHGAVYYGELEGEDLSSAFLDEVTERFRVGLAADGDAADEPMCIDVVRQVMQAYGIRDVNLVKPGIGETTRVLLRRVPWKILLNDKCMGSGQLDHILELAVEKDVLCETSKVPLGRYMACGLIRDLGDV